ncbi:transcription-repair coupling factor [Shumkonia mesophila]|uniref:transcription-repair coupling factor n=1 Tax=Shumkonia mesophila TaxID=2838854 RepID=UPI002934EDDB|nr:transcription-repair coupling factor [Shumkonia mesophila]
MKNLLEKLKSQGRLQVWGAPQGYDARILAELAAGGLDILFIARDDVRLAQTSEAVAFFAPDVERLEFPAWDCLPYDRVSPNAQIVSRRIDTLTRLLTGRPSPAQARIVLTTVSAILQRVPPREAFAGATLTIAAGGRLDPGAVTDFLVRHGFGRSETVMEPGEFAVRGGIVDVFPPGLDMPVRLDFFGDELEGIRTFEPTSQRSTGKLEATVLKPVSEVPLDKEAIQRFRTGYRELIGAAIHDDALYEAVSEGRRHIGMEHWLPLFYGRLETLFDYLPAGAVILDHQAEEARDARLDLIDEYYLTRRSIADGKLAATATPYNPVPSERLYLDAAEWRTLLVEKPLATLSPFAGPVSEDSPDAGGRPGRDFSDARVRPDVNVFDDIRDHAKAEMRGGRRVVIAAFSAGSRDRLGSLLKEHGLDALSPAETWAEVSTLGADRVAMAVLGIERGFAGPDAVFISEQDILGERMNRPSRRKIRPENVIADATALSEGDLVVHVDHGIGRYDGLTTIEVGGAPHDCLRILYDGGDKLFLPVENIEVLSRYGSDQTDAQLDRLGGAAWQARKARLKQRIRDMAEKLIGVAAARQLRPAPVLAPPEGLFEEFCARFPYTETEDQYRAIQDTLGDLARGIPADRLICGDVGFGKTEVALRAAFVSVLSGRQVAVVVPTTLLCRQHFQTFRARFADYPVRVEQLSRLVPAATAKRTKEELAKGTVDIIIGTHALLAKSIAFSDLGLLVVDEEQHFGVAHKERLKQIKSDVHVLTLSATPIPRTLQMALTGVRELSLIATPPVDRLAVRTFVLPYDPVIIREAILRERYRGGQTFYVCPRIEDLEGVSEALAKLVPEVNVILAHGKMTPSELEARVATFYDGKADILLSTNIIESGLDLPSVNTIIIHRADRFGLAQLYQLRGRVGRSKVRAYAYLTLPPRQKLTPAAEKRLEVMQTLDSLGAGFSLASHDLDIRGAGNLLGEEQSGHIREVGVELYQQMLEEAVAEARGAGEGDLADTEWSPQVGLGMAVLIPESYVADLGVRLSLYRRIARLADAAEIDALAAEMIDRFGPLPAEVDNLLQTVAVKCLCRQAGVSKVEAGPRGAVLSFRNDSFANPEGMVRFLTQQVGTAKLRPDQKLVYIRSWDDVTARLKGVSWLMKELAAVAAAKN